MKYLVLFLLSGSLLTGCKSTQQKPVSAENKIPVKEQKVKATVIDMSYMDGCGYILELENNERLIAINLGAEWMKDTKKVWITYEASNQPTVCMAGKTVKLKTIEERK